MIERRFCHHDPVEYEYEYEYRCTEYEYDCPDERQSSAAPAAAGPLKHEKPKSGRRLLQRFVRPPPPFLLEGN